jgi:hypothetical protein
MKAGVVRHEDHDDASQSANTTGINCDDAGRAALAMKSKLQCR